jgi:hypothetical protein
MVPFSLVYFEGQWSREEAALIEAAVEGVEATAVPGDRGDRGAPWVAVAHETGPTGTYLASREGRIDVMAAESPEALAEQIRATERPRVGL